MRKWWFLPVRFASYEKISEAKRRQTQAFFCRALRTRPRLEIARRTSIGVPPRFSSQGVFHRKGLSTRLMLPGTRRKSCGPSVGRALPAPTCPSPARLSQPSPSARRLMPECRPGAGCKSARGHRPRPCDPTMPAGPLRFTGRGMGAYVTAPVTNVNEKGTNNFRSAAELFMLPSSRKQCQLCAQPGRPGLSL
jgi:hypothetical protein